MNAECKCGRPIADTAYVCSVCTADLRRDLLEVQRYAGEATVTIGHLDDTRRGGQPQPEEDVDDGWHKGEGALYPTALLHDPHRAQRYDRAVGELLTWARHIAEERGRYIEPYRRWALTCDHGRCARIHAAIEAGVTCPLRLVDDPLSTVAAWLADNLTWLAHRPEAPEAWSKIADACDEIEHVLDTTAGKLWYGPCACGLDLLGHRDATTVRCVGCGTTYNGDTMRADLLENAREQYVTAAQAADLIAGWVDPNASRDKVRKLVWAWADRGHIEADTDGRYQLGPILDRWTRALAARVA